MFRIVKYFLLFFLIFIFTSCGGGSTESAVQETENQTEVIKKIQFDVTVTETVRIVSVLTSDSPNTPIEIPNYSFIASFVGIESGLIIRFTMVNEDVSSYLEMLSGSKEDDVFVRQQSRTRPTNIKIMVYSESDRDNFTEKEFAFNGASWVEK